MIVYTVICEFDDDSTATEWATWLRDEHLADVCAAGAISATLVRLEASARIYEARYIFPSREDFGRYERDHAPRLREEGLRLFPLRRGLRYRRTLAEVIATCSPPSV
jgi:hypothetical protein